MNDYLQLFHSLGLHDGEIFHSKTSTTVYEYSQDSLKVKTSGVDEGFGIRILKDKKLGFSFSNSEPKIPDAIRSAISLSKFSQPSSFSFAGKQEYGNAEAYDAKAAGLDESELKAIVLEVADGIRKYSEVSRIVLSRTVSSCEIANTSLLSAGCKNTGLEIYAEAKNGDGLGSADYSSYKTIADPHPLGEKAGLMAKEMKNPKKLPAGKYAVVFSHDLLGQLCGMMLNSFSGELKRRKISKLWDKEGERMFDSRLNIYDDPFADAVEKGSFDGEGVASRKIPLIETGVVKNFLYNRETSAFAGLEKEGNCARGGYSQYPLLGPSNIVVDAEPYAGLPSSYVFMESMHGLHTANLLTGDFGAEASIAFLCENGKRTPVRGFMLSGNLFKMFGNICYIGEAIETNGNFVSPGLGFENLQLVS